MKKADRKIVVVTRRTRLSDLVRRFATRSRAAFYIASNSAVELSRKAPPAKKAREGKAPDNSFSDYEKEDAAYVRSLEVLRTQLDVGLPVQEIDREFLPNFVFGANDLIVTLGQDGLVANTAKYAGRLPIVAVNPEPERFDGILLPFVAEQVGPIVRRAIAADAARIREVTLAEARLTDGQHLLAFNDLFIGCQSHVSARYRIEFQGRSEPHSSSGVLVSTGAGSTGWLSSVFNMAASVAHLSGKDAPIAPLRMTWQDPRLVFVVREPFASRHSRIATSAGIIEAGSELVIESQMPTHGVIFSDGIEADFLAFNSGAIAHIRASDQRARLIVG